MVNNEGESLSDYSDKSIYDLIGSQPYNGE